MSEAPRVVTGWSGTERTFASPVEGGSGPPIGRPTGWSGCGFTRLHVREVP